LPHTSKIFGSERTRQRRCLSENLTAAFAGNPGRRFDTASHCGKRLGTLNAMAKIAEAAPEKL